MDFELGAAFINSANPTIMDIVNAQQLQLIRLGERSDFAVWNGSEFVFRSNLHSAFTDLKLLGKHKVSLTRMFILLREAKTQFAALYQEASRNPSSLSGLFEHAGLDNWHMRRFDQILLEQE